MAAVLNRIDDHRSTIMKMSRKELEHLARYMGREDIVPGMPADMMRRKIMENPPQQWPRPMRAVLGSQERLIVPPFDTWRKVAFLQPGQVPQQAEQKVEEVDAAADLERQWLAQQAAKTDFAEMPFYQLKKECKARGIFFKRTDSKAELVKKLNGQDTS